MIEDCIKILQGQTNITSKRDQSIIGDFLQHIPYFKGICSKEELQDRLFDLAKYVEYEEVAEHTAVFHKGEQSQYMYFILRGCISVFIPKSPQDVELEVKWRQNLEHLNEDYKNINPSSLLSQQNRQQILSQINQGKSILRCLRNQEDEELLKVNYQQKYFRQGGTICGYKKIKQLCEFDSFGESILSQQKSQRTATLIAHKGVLVKIKQPTIEDRQNSISFVQEQSNNLSKILLENNNIDTNSQFPSSFDQNLLNQQQQKQLQSTDQIKQQEQTSPSNSSQMQKVVILGKISKKNYLKVFQQELERRTFIRRALLNNFKNDLEDGVLDNLAFFFKEEHLEKNSKIIKEFEFLQSPSKCNQVNNGSMSERTEYNQDRKRAQEILENPIYSHPNQEEEFLYLLYKGSIEIRKKMTSNYTKSQVKNIDSSLQQSAVSRVSKVDLRLAQLSEGEFFGHENWFKEDFERVLSYIGEVTPTQAFNDRLIQLKKDYSIVALETDTIIYKIPRKILCEEQNRLLLKSLVIHGRQRHSRYLQLSKEAAEKQEENILKKIQLQNDYFTTEKECSKVTSQKVENLLRGKKPKSNKLKSGSQLLSLEGNDSDDSPLFKKDLKMEFDSFKIKFETAFNTAALIPISSNTQKTQLYQQKRGYSQIELASANTNNFNNVRENTQNSQILIRSPSKREFQNTGLIFSSHNFTSKVEDAQKPTSLYNLEPEETTQQPNISEKKTEFLIRQNRRQRSMYNMNEFNAEAASKSVHSFGNQQIALKQSIIEKKYAKDINQNAPFKQLLNRNEEGQGLINKEQEQESRMDPFFTEPFGHTRDKIIRKHIKNASGNPPVPKFSSLNVSPSNRNYEEQNNNEINLKSNYLKLKLCGQKSMHLPSEPSPVLIKQMSSHLSQNQSQQQQISYITGSQTSRNQLQENNEENSPNPTVIKTLNLSPRKHIIHKSTHSLINLKQVEEQQKLSQQNSIYQNQEMQNDQISNFTQLFAHINQGRDELEFQNIKGDRNDSSPQEKRVKFLLQFPNEEKKEKQSSPLQQTHKKSKIEFIKNMQKKIPLLKNSFLQQINMKKEIFKNEIVKQSISSLHEQFNKQQKLPQQIPLHEPNHLIKQKSSYSEESPSKLLHKRASGYYTNRIQEKDSQMYNFNTASQQINNINISSNPPIQRQTSLAFFTNSAQSSPKNQQIKKIKTFSIHQNPVFSSQQLIPQQQQQQMGLTQSQIRTNLQLPLKKNKIIQQYNGSYTDRDQLSSPPFMSKDNSKEDQKNQNIRIFDDHVQRFSENFSMNETKVQSAQDLDQNMLSQETAANSYDQINIAQKTTQNFSQFKINKQFMYDATKKTVSKQIIQNCFKKK